VSSIFIISVVFFFVTVTWLVSTLSDFLSNDGFGIGE